MHFVTSLATTNDDNDGTLLDLLALLDILYLPFSAIRSVHVDTMSTPIVHSRNRLPYSVYHRIDLQLAERDREPRFSGSLIGEDS